MRWCVQNLSTVNDSTNYRLVSMISNLTETIMCLIEETGDSTHERTGRGSWGLPPPPPLPPPPKFWATQIFWAAREILAKPIFAKVSMFRLLRLFFLWKRYFFIWSLSRRGKVSFIFGLWVLSIILNNTYSLCRYLQGRRSISSAVVEMPTWPYRPYASVEVKKVSTVYGKYCW